MPTTKDSKFLRQFLVAFVVILIFTALVACREVRQSGGSGGPSGGSVVVLEDEGKIIIEHGSDCGVSNKDGEQDVIKLNGSMIIPQYADRATVFLNGWFMEYLDDDQHIRSLSVDIREIQIANNTMTWKAEGYLKDEDFENPYKWCYYYTALAWNGSLIDALADHSDKNESGVQWSTKEFPNEETALVTLNPYIKNPAFASKKTIAVIPRGFWFGWNNESSWIKFDAPVDHHLLQIAYNLDHTELYIEKGRENMPASSYDQGFVSWVTHGIFKDDDAKRNFWFFEKVSALGGNAVGVVYPPFAIRPVEDPGAFTACVAEVGGVKTEDYEINNIPFEYAVPVLTGWDLKFPCGDNDVLQIGVWLHDIKYEKQPTDPVGTLRYKVSSILADNDFNPPHDIRHRVTVLGLVPRGFPAADLLPTQRPESANYCTRDSSGKLVVTVSNQGTLDAIPSTTTVIFHNGILVDVATPKINAGSSVTLPSISFPTGCFGPNCWFRIIVDAKQQIDESDEGNNIVEGMCKG